VTTSRVVNLPASIRNRLLALARTGELNFQLILITVSTDLSDTGPSALLIDHPSSNVGCPFSRLTGSSAIAELW